ncbi:MAG TPA: hypothetical protein VFS07_10060 [Gemmatimonadales bacterium]|nr:hypothetical protein [Gemmatimonadales bacterium]
MRTSLSLALLLLAGCAIAFGPPPTPIESLPVALYDADGRPVGVATFQGDSVGLTIRFDLHSLGDAPVEAVLDEHGRCERPSFLSVGAPWRTLERLAPDSAGRFQGSARFAWPKGHIDTTKLLGGDGSALLLLRGDARLACGIVV